MPAREAVVAKGCLGLIGLHGQGRDLTQLGWLALELQG